MQSYLFFTQEISSIVTWLAHEECRENGLLIKFEHGLLTKYSWQKSKGFSVLDENGKLMKFSPEDISQKWMTNIHDGLFDSMAVESHEFKPLEVVGYTSKEYRFSYSSKDVILYALGIGVSLNSQEDGLRYLYEGHPQFAPLPGYGVIPAFPCLETVIHGHVPNLDIDLTKVLHGEQYTEFVTPLPVTANDLISTFEISAVLDKGKAGSVILIDVETKQNESSSILIKNQFSIFLVNCGEFGGPRDSNKVIKTIPSPIDRKPDASFESKTSQDQAAIYRLSGDTNPLHIDPIFAKMGGLEQPILHGLCSYGIALFHVIKAFANNDPSAIKAVKTRFAAPVLPGQTIRTEMWMDKHELILFRCVITETGKECISGGWAQLHKNRCL